MRKIPKHDTTWGQFLFKKDTVKFRLFEIEIKYGYIIFYFPLYQLCIFFIDPQGS